jgi:hypothetical protein
MRARCTCPVTCHTCRLQEELVAAAGRASLLRDMVERETEKAEGVRQEVAAHEARGPDAETTAKLKAQLQEVSVSVHL